MAKKKDTIEANGFAIQIYTEDFQNDYISLTDIARYKSDEPFIVINNWLRSKDNIQFLGLWESMNNPDFKPIEFDRFKNEAGSNAFTLSPQKWIEKTNAIGIVSKSGRYGGTFAHSDIALEFASWISPEFKLYIIQDYKRLKSNENSNLSFNWNLNREISKINYKIHTDAIKKYLLADLTKEQLSYKYANEADMLNVALFNKQAKQWREENPNSKGNIRDYASLNELLVLANMESYNAVLISKGMQQQERMIELRKLARTQLTSLERLNNTAFNSLEDKTKKQSEATTRWK
ncbi:KilA-N domain-containing protein [Treponema sp.]|uniref:KilA-N domain-containing protein n=1 Tax=Treponema sp. TaxID=166 RepID=UPI003FA1A858